MTIDDLIKLTWTQADRHDQLNRVVEMLASVGVKREVLDEALGRLLDEVRNRDEGEEAEEVIAGVGDRLHGWCHPSRVIPTAEAFTDHSAPAR